MSSGGGRKISSRKKAKSKSFSVMSLVAYDHTKPRKSMTKEEKSWEDEYLNQMRTLGDLTMLCGWADEHHLKDEDLRNHHAKSMAPETKKALLEYVKGNPCKAAGDHEGLICYYGGLAPHKARNRVIHQCMKKKPHLFRHVPDHVDY